MAYTPSNDYKTKAKSLSVFWKSYIKVLPDNIDITDETYLQSWTLKNEIYNEQNNTLIGNAVSKLLNLQFVNDNTYNLENKEIELYLGVVKNPTADKASWVIEYVPHGKYIVQPIASGDIPAITKFTAYDYMIKFNGTFEQGSLTYPTTATLLLQHIASQCGVTLHSSVFTNDDFAIEDGTAFTEYTYREVLSSIAKLSGTVAIINRDNELQLKYFNDYSGMEEITATGSEITINEPTNTNKAFITNISGSSSQLTIASGNNKVVNGNFVDTSSWITSDATFTVSNNIASITASAKWGNIRQTFSTISSHKYYVSGYITGTKNNCLTIGWVIDKFATSTTRQKISHLFTAAKTLYDLKFQDNRTTGWTPFTVEQAFIVDLTALFGAGYEPTIEWCDINLTYDKVTNGTPNPTSPSIIQSVGDEGAINVWEHKKNLFTKQGWSTPATDTYFWYALSNSPNEKATPLSDGWIKVENLITRSSPGYVNMFTNASALQLLEPSTTYTFCYEIRNKVGTPNILTFTDSESDVFLNNASENINNLVEGTIYTKSLVTVGTDLSTKTLALRTFATVPTGYAPFSFEIRCWVVKGTSATSYEPYTGNTYQVTLTQPLRSLPNGVKDTIDNGVLTRRVGKTILTATGDISGAKTNSQYTCDISTTGTLTGTTFTMPSGGTSATVLYELATPITENVTVPSIDTYEDYTIISTTNTVKPTMEISYYEDVENIIKDNYFTFEKSNKFGGVNELILNSYDIDGLNVTEQDSQGIIDNGLMPITIQEKLLMYNQTLRTNAITELWYNLHNVEYRPFTMKTSSFNWLDPFDKITITDIDSNSYSTYVFNQVLTYNGSFKNELKTIALTQKEVELKYVNSENLSKQRTEIIVNQHTNEIQLINEELQNVSIINQGETAPESPNTGDLWLNTNDNIIYRYDGSEWKATSISSDSLLQYYTKAEIDVRDSSITSSVSELQVSLNNDYYTSSQTQSLIDANSEDITYINGQITTLNQTSSKLSLDVTKIQTDGVDKVTTTTGFKFDDTGLNISKTDEPMRSLIDNTGLYVDKYIGEIAENQLTVNDTGISGKQLKISTSFEIGTKSKIQDYEDGTGIFYIG